MTNFTPDSERDTPGIALSRCETSSLTAAGPWFDFYFDALVNCNVRELAHQMCHSAAKYINS